MIDEIYAGRIDDPLARVFNEIFYDTPLAESSLLQFEKNIIRSYLAPDIGEHAMQHNSMRRCIFASFIAGNAPEAQARESLYRMLLAPADPEYTDGVNSEPLVRSYLRDAACRALVFHKQDLKSDKLRLYEPNIAAIVASSGYREAFFNRSLVGLARLASDKEDLQALVVIDYLFRDVTGRDVSGIVDADCCLESRALLALAHAKDILNRHRMQKLAEDDNAKQMFREMRTALDKEKQPTSWLERLLHRR